MPDNDVITRSELKQYQLQQKMEANIDALQLKTREYEIENEKLSGRLDVLKNQNIKLQTTNENLTEEIRRLKFENHSSLGQAHEKVSEVKEEAELLNYLLIDVRDYFINNKDILLFLGKEADKVFSQFHSKGRNNFNYDELKNSGFPIPLLVEIDEFEFCINTSNFRLTRDENEYKLTTNITANGNEQDKNN